VEVGVAAQPGVAEAVRVPVPADQLCAGVVQEVVPVCGRGDVPAFPAVLDELELVTERELDGADAGGG
jgi:hypothetical protein